MIRIRKKDVLETYSPQRIFNVDEQLEPFFNPGVCGDYMFISESGFWKAMFYGDRFALIDGAGSFGRPLPRNVVRIAKTYKEKYWKMKPKDVENVRLLILDQLYKAAEKR